jgi:acyl-coenzyme A thioesterase PaaI-like protein
MVSIPQVSINTDMSEGLCFCCGQNNPIGLKLNFKRDGRGVRTEFVPGKHHQGWPGMVHGGIIGCLLDEAVSYAAQLLGVKCLTARIEMRLRRPALLQETLVITSHIKRHTRKLINSEAKISLEDGTVVAEGSATQFVIEESENNQEEPRADA